MSHPLHSGKLIPGPAVQYRPARPLPTRRIRTASAGANSSIRFQVWPCRSMKLIQP